MGLLHDRLIQACEKGDIDATRRRLKRGLDVNAWGGLDNETALIAATIRDQLGMAKYLLDEAGADVNAIDKAHRTALYYAQGNDMAVLLLSKRAEVNARDQDGVTPLHAACEWVRDDVVRILLEAGASVDATNRSNESPVRHAMAGAARYPEDLGAATRVLQDLVRYGGQWHPSCEEELDNLLSDTIKRWQRVGSALRHAVLHWIEQHRLGVPLSNIPEEEIEKGLQATHTYIQELQASSQIVCRRTICVVGPTTAGKTSLIKSLIKNQVCCEHIDDRTIGIDHFILEFDEPEAMIESGKRRTHQVKFSDFAGQDVYQVMHSLFFTKRTLFLIAVDLNAYSVTLLKCEMLTQDDAKLQHRMNEYVDRTVLAWIRIILARQPDAEFAFIYTKYDTIASGPGVDKHEVLAHVERMLQRVIAIVYDMKRAKPRARDHTVRAASAVGNVTTERETQHWFQRMRRSANAIVDSMRCSENAVVVTGDTPSTQPTPITPITPITHLWDARLEHCRKHSVTSIVTSSTTVSSVQSVRNALERLIMASGRSYETPEKYMRVLRALVRKRQRAEKLPIYGRIQETFMDVRKLISKLQQGIAGLDTVTAETILRTLRDCVDILWYEDMEDAKLQMTVMLDPAMLIEFLRHVINHKHATGAIDHATLSGLSYWRDLNSEQATMLAMKRLLQTFRLVHPASGDMAFDSDLIVPLYWKTNQPAIWKFGGEDLRLNARGFEVETVARRVYWELRFTHFIPETLFDLFVVASYSPVQPLEVGPDWILYRDAELAACRVMLSRHWKTHERSLLLEAVLAKAPNAEEQAVVLWRIFKRLCKALAGVLMEHPGLQVTRSARMESEGRQPSLASVLHAMNEDAMDTKWLPPEPVAAECIRLLVGLPAVAQPT